MPGLNPEMDARKLRSQAYPAGPDDYWKRQGQRGGHLWADFAGLVGFFWVGPARYCCHVLCLVCGLVTCSKLDFGNLAKSQLTFLQNHQAATCYR